MKLDCVLQDEDSNDLPPVHLLYKPVRQLIYGVMFDVSLKHKKAKDEEGMLPGRRLWPIHP